MQLILLVIMRKKNGNDSSNAESHERFIAS